MELKDVKAVLKRVQINYPSFVNDNYTQSEWYKELKDYDLQDVMEKLEQHFRSEQYGNSIPKVYFLTKYLTKTKDKNKKIEYRVNCNLCGKEMTLQKYDEHYGTCLEIKTLQKWIKEKNGTEPTYEELAGLDRNTFNRVYQKYMKNEADSTKISFLLKDVVDKLGG